MSSIRDDRGYNQGFQWSETLRIRTERRAQMIASEVARFPTPDNTPVLELGSGTGELAAALVQIVDTNVLGTDLCEPFVEQANKHYASERLHFIRVDGTRLNHTPALADRHFRAVVGNGILHHLYPTLKDSLVEMKSLLNQDGRIVFIEPNLFNPYVFLLFRIPFLRKLGKLEPAEMAFSPGYAKRLLLEAGYVDIKVKFVDFLIPNLPRLLIAPVVALGAVLERFRLTSWLAQSIIISGRKR